MASTITNYSNLIYINYPSPGGDNDSQGFRSNFSNIQTALEIGGSEISDLQLNLVNLSGVNDFGGNEIRSATIIESTIVLQNYTVAELEDLIDQGTLQNGTLVFVTDSYNCPAYHYNGVWYAMTGTSITS